MPELAERIGHDLVTSDGTTLLGADDKAGVAIIVTAARASLRGRRAAGDAPDRLHGRRGDRPGHGALRPRRLRRRLRLHARRLGPRRARDRDLLRRTSSCSRSRASACIPGTAKGRLVNALKLAARADRGASADGLSPETTEEREGFVHPERHPGTAGRGDGLVHRARPRRREARGARRAPARARGRVVGREPRAHVDARRRGAVPEHAAGDRPAPRVVEAAEEAIRRVGVEPVHSIIRGGTDGSRLSEMGLPTPNLFTGGQHYHSRARVGVRPGHGARRPRRVGRAASAALGRAVGLASEATADGQVAWTSQPSHSCPKRRISSMIGRSACPCRSARTRRAAATPVAAPDDDLLRLEPAQPLGERARADPGHECSSSVKRRGPSERSWTMSTVHFEPTISAAPRPSTAPPRGPRASCASTSSHVLSVRPVAVDVEPRFLLRGGVSRGALARRHARCTT